MIDTNAATATLAADGTLSVQGTINDDEIDVTRHGQSMFVSLGGESLGSFDAKSVKSVVVDAGAGDDAVSVGNSVHAAAALLGGLGDDVLNAGGGSSILVGGGGADDLNGGAKEDLLLGGTTTANVAAALAKWDGAGNHAARVSSLRSTFNATSIADDGAADVISGGGSKDWFFRSGSDVLTDRQSGETLN